MSDYTPTREEIMDTDTALIIAWVTAREIMFDAEANGLTDSYYLGRHTAAESILSTLPNPYREKGQDA